MSVPQPSASASYPERARQFAKLFWPLTEAASSVMITGHENPDDDSIGSVMAMYEILKTKYPEKKIDIQYPEPMGDRWHTFSTFKEIKTTKDMNAAVSRYELVIFLDGSEYFRFRLDSTKVDVGGRKTVCIDHHSNAPDTFDLSLLEPKATSVSELIYYAVCESASQLSQNVIESLLLGIFGDTLMFDWVGPDQTPVFAAVARLMQEGNIISNEFRARYSTYSERVFTLLQEFVKQAKIQRISSWPPFLGSIVSRAFVSKGQYADDRTYAL